MQSNSDFLHQQFDAAFEFDETPDQLEAIAAIYRRPRATAGRWTAAVRRRWASARPRWPCGPRSRRWRAGTRWRSWRPPPFSPTNIWRPFAPVSRLPGRRIDMISRFGARPPRFADHRRSVWRRQDRHSDRHPPAAQSGRRLDFPKLGLLIVDEEQRFGVAQKESSRAQARDVHVLAMSATPVPRTLQLSLAGVRDLSLIETPPRDRMAVETAILPFDRGAHPRGGRVRARAPGAGLLRLQPGRDDRQDGASYLKETLPGPSRSPSATASSTRTSWRGACTPSRASTTCCWRRPSSRTASTFPTSTP